MGVSNPPSLGRPFFAYYNPVNSAGNKRRNCQWTEPTDYEVYGFILKNYSRLRFSPAVATDVKDAARNPKRIQREVHRQVQSTGIGTKAQQALKLQQEQWKTERKTLSREQREAEKERQFELKQQKRKEKHRGR